MTHDTRSTAHADSGSIFRLLAIGLVDPRTPGNHFEQKDACFRHLAKKCSFPHGVFS
jgi:hypothetical protein